MHVCTYFFFFFFLTALGFEVRASLLLAGATLTVSLSPFLLQFFWQHWVCITGLTLAVALPLEPLSQPYLRMCFFKIRSHEPFAQGGIQTLILLTSASRVARIMSS
jgi:hypothetical protein